MTEKYSPRINSRTVTQKTYTSHIDGDMYALIKRLYKYLPMTKLIEAVLLVDEKAITKVLLSKDLKEYLKGVRSVI